MRALQRHLAKRTPIGLDIGHSGVRAVQLKRRDDGWVVCGVSCCERPLTSTPDQTNGEGELEQQIRACIDRADFHGRKTRVALSSPDVEFHALELPAAILSKPTPQVTAIVRSEMQRLMSDSEQSNRERIEAGYWSLPSRNVSGPNTLGAIARHDVIHRTLSACDKARVKCEGIDTVATALCRLGSLLHPWEPEALWGVLDVGYRQTRLVLCVDAVPVLVRAVATGGGDWTQRIGESLEISNKAAEVHKCEHGLTLPYSVRNGESESCVDAPPGHEPSDRGVRSELGSMLFGILRSDLNALAAEIKRSYEYVLSCYPSKKAADVMLVGGGAGLRGLPEFLSHELGIPVHPASTYLDDDRARIRYPSRKQSPIDVFGLAMGLAIDPPSKG